MSVDTRARILAAAEQLFGQHGFAATRLAHIAKASGLGNAGLLHHFPSKAALYRAVLASIAEDLNGRYTLTADSIAGAAQLAQLVEALLTMHRERPSAMAIIAHEFLDQSGRIEEADFLPLAQIVRDTVAILEAGQQAGTVRQGDPVAMSAALHGTLMIGCLGRKVYRRTGGTTAFEQWEAELALSALASVQPTS